jgi:hypothetical protein
MHGVRAPLTAPHEIAASEIGAIIMQINKTTHATFMFAIVFLKDNVLLFRFFLGLFIYFDECNVLGCVGGFI